MAVFRIEKTRDYTVIQPPPAQCGSVSEIQRAALHDAVLAGGLELHHQGLGQNLQGGHGQQRISPEGAGTGRIHSPQSAAGQQGQDCGRRVCHLRDAPSPGHGPAV